MTFPNASKQKNLLCETISFSLSSWDFQVPDGENKGDQIPPVLQLLCRTQRQIPAQGFWLAKAVQFLDRHFQRVQKKNGLQNFIQVFPEGYHLELPNQSWKTKKTNRSHTSFNLDWSWSSPHVDLSWIISQFELRTLQVYPSAHQQTKVVRLERSDRAPDGEEGADQGSTSPGSRLSPQVEGHFFHLPWIIEGH